ncbi:hypothetical protein AB0C41_32845 [Micromonospora taraxaci]|uniref:hypothetical protein n=1 Tax=Micromonospora taraxaci TaxID=1316803 RepID=UPI0033C8D01A
MSGKDHFEKEPFDPDVHEAFKRAVASRGSRPSIPNDAGIEAPEEIAERGRAMFRRALMQADADDLQEDLRQMLEALGMSAHARPYSPHRVFQEALNEMKRQLVAVPRSAASTVEPVADFATEEQLRELFGEEDEPLADVINTHDGQWRSVGTCWRWHPYVESLSVPKVSIEPAAPTTSPEPDAVRDKIARIIDGRAFDNWQGQYDYAIKDNPAEFAQRCADAYYKEAKDTALEKADAVLAALSRPAHGGWEALAVECSECVIPRPEQMNIYRAHALLKRAAIALARNNRVTSQPDTDAVTIVAPPIPPLLQREWMAQALFEVDAPDHREWEDVWLDERERYLRLADTAIQKATMLGLSS